MEISLPSHRSVILLQLEMMNITLLQNMQCIISFSRIIIIFLQLQQWKSHSAVINDTAANGGPLLRVSERPTEAVGGSLHGITAHPGHVEGGKAVEGTVGSGKDRGPAGGSVSCWKSCTLDPISDLSTCCIPFAFYNLHQQNSCLGPKETMIMWPSPFPTIACSLLQQWWLQGRQKMVGDRIQLLNILILVGSKVQNLHGVYNVI